MELAVAIHSMASSGYLNGQILPQHVRFAVDTMNIYMTDFLGSDKKPDWYSLTIEDLFPFYCRKDDFESTTIRKDIKAVVVLIVALMMPYYHDIQDPSITECADQAEAMDHIFHKHHQRFDRISILLINNALSEESDVVKQLHSVRLLALRAQSTLEKDATYHHCTGDMSEWRWCYREEDLVKDMVYDVTSQSNHPADATHYYW
jgi:hypothetical protein